ncbi:hypothetical protein ABZY09_16005 [Streptomyces sp. NPDC002928]|uniref:hypothetical protein n=1 Tax=Streptomyces sp. NPDC002928 TaxID=3154440 RepID=UPI00339E6119
MILIALLRVVVDEFLHRGLDESDLGEDLVGRGGPGEGFRVWFRMSSRSMNMIWLRFAASKALPSQLRAALVISPAATMKA